MQARFRQVDLALRYPFGIARGTVTSIPTLLAQIAGGVGEAAPVRYHQQTVEEARRLLELLAAGVTEQNMDDIALHEKRARDVAPAHSAARCALDVALWSGRAARAGKPLWELLDAPPPDKLTSYTIALADTPDEMGARAREASDMPYLKVKLGRDLDFDLEAIKAVWRAAPRSELWVDANAGWSWDTARKMIPELAYYGVTLVEQPLAIGSIVETGRLRQISELPIFVDEDAQDLASLPALRGQIDGINIKLAKCGGISEALRMIDFAKAEGWRVFLGCMVESRVGLGAAVQLAGLVDHVDLDGHMLTTNDPVPPGSLRVPAPDLPTCAGPLDLLFESDDDD